MFETDGKVISERKELPGVTSAGTKTFMLSAVDTVDSWRIIEALSTEGRPFELEVHWSASKVSGPWVKTTVSHATRLCVFAKGVTLYATNVSSKSNTVIVLVPDGFAQTANVWEHRATTTASTPLVIPIPPFAASFDLNLAQRDALPGANITIFDGQGKARAHFSAANQPPGGIPVGGAGKLEVTTTGAIDLRGIFTLLI